MEKVTTRQFYSVIFLTLLTGLFMFSSSQSKDAATTDTVLKPLLFGLINFILTLPLFCFLKNESSDALQYLSGKSRVLCVITDIIFLGSFLLSVIRTVSQLNLFLSSAMFEDTDLTGFTIAIIAVCCLIAYSGLGAVSRGSVIFTVLVVIGTLSVSFVAAFKDFNVLNFTPIFKNGIKEFFKETLLASFFPMEISGILLFNNRLSGDIKKGYKTFLLFSVLITLFFSVCMVGCLGEFANIQLFPFFTLSTIEGIGLIERFDVLVTSSWLFCVISALSFQILCFKKCFNNIAKKEFKFAPLVVCFLITAPVCTYISSDINNFSFLTSPVAYSVAYFLTVVIIPIICIIVKHFKNKRVENVE